MSSGSRIKVYYCPETVAGVTPATPVWQTTRRVTDGLNAKVNTTESGETTEDRMSQGAITVSMDIVGMLVCESSYGTNDPLLAAAGYNPWVVDAPIAGSDTLTLAGNTRQTFTFVKVFSDVGVVHIYRGVHISTLEIAIPKDGKVTETYGLMGLSFEKSLTNPVTSPVAASTTPFVSVINVDEILLDGVSMAGIACISDFNLKLDNSLQVQRCIGSGLLGPGALIANIAKITGSMTLAYSADSDALLDKVVTRTPVSIKVGIMDSLGNGRTITLPEVELMGDRPDAGNAAIVEAKVDIMAVRTPPTITRTAA